MYLNNYNFITKNLLINQVNFYNINTISDVPYIALFSSFNTFKSEKNLKFIKLYCLLLYVGNQRPFLKKVKFSYMKKKILKRFIISSALNKGNKNNFLFYIVNFYTYFFQIYYQKLLKYNYTSGNVLIYIDNIQLFFRNYNKQNQKTQIKIAFSSKKYSDKILLRYLSGVFLLKLKIKK
jgi:hypothetical protein